MSKLKQQLAKEPHQVQEWLLKLQLLLLSLQLRHLLQLFLWTPTLCRIQAQFQLRLLLILPLLQCLDQQQVLLHNQLLWVQLGFNSLLCLWHLYLQFPPEVPLSLLLLSVLTQQSRMDIYWSFILFFSDSIILFILTTSFRILTSEEARKLQQLKTLCILQMELLLRTLRYTHWLFQFTALFFSSTISGRGKMIF